MGWRDVEKGVEDGSISFAPKPKKRNVLDSINDGLSLYLDLNKDEIDASIAKKLEIDSTIKEKEKADAAALQLAKSAMTTLGYDPSNTKLRQTIFQMAVGGNFTNLNDLTEYVEKYGPTPSATPSKLPNDVGTAGGGRARRNNNPGNLKYVGQKGATKGEDGFAVFPTPFDGMKAMRRQLFMDVSPQGRNLNLTDFITKYAPPSDNNDTAAYIAFVAKEMGIGETDNISGDQLTALQTAMIKMEAGNDAAYFLGGPEPENQTTDNLEGTQDTNKKGWGVGQVNPLAGMTFAELENTAELEGPNQQNAIDALKGIKATRQKTVAQTLQAADSPAKARALQLAIPFMPAGQRKTKLEAAIVAHLAGVTSTADRNKSTAQAAWRTGSVTNSNAQDFLQNTLQAIDDTRTKETSDEEVDFLQKRLDLIKSVIKGNADPAGEPDWLGGTVTAGVANSYLTSAEGALAEAKIADQTNPALITQLEARIAAIKTVQERNAPEAPLPKYMTETVTANNSVSFLVDIDGDLKQLGADDVARIPLLERRQRVLATQNAFKTLDNIGHSPSITDETFEATVPNTIEGGENETLVLHKTKGGKYWSFGRQEYIDPKTIIGEPSSSSAEITNTVNLINKFSADFDKPLQQTKADTSTLLIAAKQLDDFVRENEAIVTTVGGPFSAALIALGNELAAVSATFNNKEMTPAAMGAALTAKADEVFSSDEFSTVLQNNARAFNQWKALNLKHAFAFAKLSLDSSGMALSNFDFKNAMMINNVGSNYKTYSENLHRQTNGVLAQARKKHELVLTGTAEYNAASEMSGVRRAYEGTDTIMPLDEYLQREEISADAFSWANNEFAVQSVASDAVPETQPVLMPINDYMNNENYLIGLKRQYDTFSNDNPEWVPYLIRDEARSIYGENPTEEQIAEFKNILLTTQVFQGVEQ